MDDAPGCVLSIESTAPWTTVRLLGGATWGSATRPSAHAYVLRDRKTLRLFGPGTLAMNVVAPRGMADLEMEVCKPEEGRVTVHNDGDIAWNALEGPLPPQRHHCKKVLLVL